MYKLFIAAYNKQFRLYNVSIKIGKYRLLFDGFIVYRWLRASEIIEDVNTNLNTNPSVDICHYLHYYFSNI